jgi:hypothetical protein
VPSSQSNRVSVLSSLGQYLRRHTLSNVLTLHHIRLPFYWEVRTLFLLYISLPQTQVCLVPFRSHISASLNPFLGFYLHLQRLLRALLREKRSGLGRWDNCRAEQHHCLLSCAHFYPHRHSLEPFEQGPHHQAIFYCRRGRKVWGTWCWSGSAEKHLECLPTCGPGGLRARGCPKGS